MYKDVEFVCAGNKGRSPLAEAFARRWLSQRSQIDYARLSSSGTLVDLLKSQDSTTQMKLAEPFIPKALEQGIVTPELAEQVRQGINIKEFLDLVFTEVRKREQEQRRYALEERGLVAYWDLSRSARQTIARPEAELIFPIGRDNYERTSEIYFASGFSPRVKLLGDIKDPILATLEEYQECVNQTEEAVERVMVGYFR